MKQRHSQFPVLVSILWLVACIALQTGCAPEESTPPPLFNAIDSSVQCKSGKLGWDFSTGGGVGEAFVSEPVRGIRIRSAQMGGNCGQDIAGDYTARFERVCSGRAECTYIVAATDDPYPFCKEELKIDYTCGIEDPVYTVVLTPEPVSALAPNVVAPITGRKAELKCGAKIEIVAATYGQNCGVAAGYHTKDIGDFCNDRRSCTIDPNEVIGDPVFGCGKRFSVEYRCGGRYQTTLSTTGQEPVTIDCDVEPDPNTPKITVETASVTVPPPVFPMQSETFDVASTVRTQCDDRGDCFFAPTGYDRNPSVAVTYRCGSEPTVLSAASTANDTGVRISCVTTYSTKENEGIRVKTATYGPECAAASGNRTVEANSRCFGKAACSYEALPYPGDQSCDGTASTTLSIEYTCGKDPEVFSASSTASVKLSCVPRVRVKSASYGTECGESKGNYSEELKEACRGKRGLCEYTTPTTCDQATDMDVSFSCGSDPTLHKAFGVGTKTTLLCPDPTETVTKKACVPSVCKGKKQRDRGLNCVETDDLPVYYGLEISNVFIHRSYEPSEDYDSNTNVRTLKPGTPYLISARFKKSISDVKGRLAIWVTDRYEPVATDSAEESYEGFSCVLANLDVNMTTSSSSGITIRAPEQQISPECFAQKNTWGDAANRAGIEETTFRQRYKFVRNVIHASFDPEGKAGYLQQSSKPTTSQISKMVMPNPPGFFYDKEKSWVDLASYYAQRELELPVETDSGTAPTTYVFARPLRIDIGLKPGKLRTTELDLELFASDAEIVDVDFTWFLTGEDDRNPFGPRASFPGVDNIRARNLRAVATLFPLASDGTASTTAEPVTLGTVRLSKLGEPSATGRTVSAPFRLSSEVKDKLFDAWKNENSFGVRVCLRMDGVTPGTDPTQFAGPGAATVNGVSYTVGLHNRSACRTMRGTLVIRSRDTLKRSVAAARSDGALSLGSTDTSGDDRSESNADSAQTSDCVQTTSGSMRCTSYRRNASEQAGAFGRSFYEVEGHSAREESDTAVTSESSTTVEVLGFQVLDADDGEQSSNSSKAAWGSEPPPPLTISISPDWKAIASALKKTTKSVKPAKPEIEAGRIGNGNGLAFGLAVTVPGAIGPLPGEVTIRATVGAAVAFEIEIPYQPEAPYPCIGAKGTKCYAFAGTARTLAQAATACGASGGRLAELSSTEVRTGFEAALPMGSLQTFWTGGSLGYRFASTECGKQSLTGMVSDACKAESTTSYRWGGSDVQFASSTGTSSSVTYDTTKVAFQTNKMALTTSVPAYAGVAFDNQTKRLVARPGSDTLFSVCEYDAAPSVSWSGYTAGFNIGAAAGVGLDVCTPSGDFGVCVGGTLNIIEAELKPGVSVSSFELRDSLGKRFGVRGNTKTQAPYEVWLLVGRIEASFNFFIGSVVQTIAEWKGKRITEGKLFPDIDSPTKQDFQ